MNCLFETVASMWIMTLRTLRGKSPPDLNDESIQEGLEGCRMSLEVRETELSEACKRLGREALKRKASGDISGARSKLMERRRGMKRLEKLRSSLVLVDTQLDALRNTELDRELMTTLMASSAALKKAGVGTGVREAEAVMSELDEQMREASELNSVLTTNQSLDVDLDFDLDEELRIFMDEDEKSAVVTAVPDVINNNAKALKLPSVPTIKEDMEVVSEDETKALLPSAVRTNQPGPRQISRLIF